MNRLAEIRKEAGFTQAELAALLNITQGAVSQWEQGATHPTYAVLKRLANILNISLDDLIEGDEDDTTADGE